MKAACAGNDRSGDDAEIAPDLKAGASGDIESTGGGAAAIQGESTFAHVDDA